MRSSALKKTAAFLQITAMVLLQFYAVSPLLSRSFAGHARVMRCNGNHAACGCSPERIASHTCCCYQSKHLVKTPSAATEAEQCEIHGNHADHDGHPELTAKKCCPDDKQARSPRGNLAGNPELAGPESRAKDKQGRSLPTVCAVPCGGDPEVITTSLDNLKFLCPSVLQAEPAAFTAEYHLPRSALFQSRVPEPPDPPPRLSLLS